MALAASLRCPGALPPRWVLWVRHGRAAGDRGAAGCDGAALATWAWSISDQAVEAVDLGC